MRRVYAFTNENVVSFNSLYDFSNARVLSVIGSGDQYFASKLFGASEVELFDINDFAWDYFVLKFFGIMILNYEEFFDYFVRKKLNDSEYFNILSSYLPYDVLNRLREKFRKYGDFSCFMNYLDIHPIIYNDGTIIPYLDKDKYYQLQRILRNTKLPIFYLMDLRNLPDYLSDKNYDIILASNIFKWIYPNAEIHEIEEFKNLLNRFNCGVIQAMYDGCLMNYPDEIEILKEKGFDIEYVYSSDPFKFFDDSVISLRKK